MKKTLSTTLAICSFTCLTLMADEVIKTFIIQKDEKTFEVSNMPTFTTSEPIANSIVYIDNELVEPPYIVATSNLNVYINERVVREFIPHILLPYYYTKTQPELPPEINEETERHDERILNYIGMTCYFLQEIEKLTDEQTIDEMFLAYQSLPVVVNIVKKPHELIELTEFIITYQDGKIESELVLPIMGRLPPYRLDDVGIHIDQLCISYTNRLTQGFQIKIAQGVEVESTKLP